MDRHGGEGPLRGRPVSGLEAAHASEYFEPFLNATTLKSILGYHRSMCELLHLKPNVFPQFYPKLRANLTSWRAKALWKKFDARASHKCYGKGKLCAGTRVLVIGGGPCGLRTAIEAQMLGAKVVVIEKRDRLSRNNVLHLWPFVIEDLRMLGAKKFFGKFCAGSIDHISIRQLQCVLLKVALLLGVEVHTEVSFEKLVEPSSVEKTGWRAEVSPENHPVSQYEFDVIIGADGKRNTLQGFKRKEFRGKLAIAITANFINKKTEAEARVEEISGVAFIFNQKFFKDLHHETRIDLENIVYYKDDTHYFVMTAKKASLLEKGVIKQDLADTEKLLAPDNVNREALQNYAREAADFSTNYQLPDLEFAVNHYGQPDVAMFDFTSMYAAEYASKVLERNGHRLLMILVGDSLLEPFWPTGSGCARGFLSSLDAAWAIRSWSSGQMTPLDVLAERESIYRLLAQTTPDNLNKDWKSYTLEPSTRYPNLNRSVVTSHQTVCLYDTDNPESIDKMKRASLEDANKQEHVSKKRRRGLLSKEALISWLKDQLSNENDISFNDITSVFQDGKALCAIINHYRPDLLDHSAIENNEPATCNQMAMDILEKEFGIPPFMTGEEITNTEDHLAITAYLTQVYDTFRGEIPHIKHPKLKSNLKRTKAHEKHTPALFNKKSNLMDLKSSNKDHGIERIIRSGNRNEKKSNDYNVTVKTLNNSSFDDFKIVQIRPENTATQKKSNPNCGTKSKPCRAKSKKTYLTVSIGCFNNSKKNIKEDFHNVQNFESKIRISKKSNKNILKNIEMKSFVQSGKGNSKEEFIIEERLGLTSGDAKIINSHGVYCQMPNFLTSSRKQYECRENNHKFLLAKNLKREFIENNTSPFSSKFIDLKVKTKSIKKNSKSSSPIKVKRFSKMDFFEENESLPPQIYNRVQKWISQHDFKADEVKKDPEGETLFTCDVTSDITSVTRARSKRKGEYDDIKVEERTDVIKCESPVSSSQEDFIELIKHLKDGKSYLKDNKGVVKPVTKFSLCNMKSVSAPPANFSVIVEGEESELPDRSKRSEFSFKSIKTTNLSPSNVANQHSRPSSRHKRHAEMVVPKTCSIERKQRKRRTLDKIGPSVEERQKVLEEITANRQDRQSKRKQQRQRQTQQFIKSMQMLQANAKPDQSEPFEDYSIFLYRQTAPKFEDRVKDLEKQFTYVPDYDIRSTGSKPLTNTNADEDIASKIRSLEDKWSNQQPVEKKPKDLMRAIGKIAKYADIDKNIKELDLKLKEGTSRELSQNKVASITEKLIIKVPQEKKPPEKNIQPKSINLPVQSGSEFCHFCGKRVYLMERLSAESRFFHHGCFKCQYCHTQLRLGSYMFDRDGQFGHRFFCMHHFGMPGELPRPSKIVRKQSQKGERESARSPHKKAISGVSGVDLLDRVHTPERIEFSNLSTGNISSDHDEPLSQMDEDEWTDKNFGASCNELDEESDEDSSSSLGGSDSDDEDAFDDALEQPITKEGTLKWAERWKNSYRKGRHDSDGYSSTDHSSYYENISDDSDSDTATEGEEEIRARELRKQEVRVEPPVVQTDTGTDTEMLSEESSSESSSEIQNSATEVSTDSEFAQDEPTPTREKSLPDLNNIYVNKIRGSGKSNHPKKIHVTTGYINKNVHEKPVSKPDVELKLSPLVSSTPNIKRPTPILLPRTEGYALNRTQSTGGIAAKVSLELKKKYLLGESGSNGIQKSGSASTLETKFKSFQNTISDCQKLLKPSTEVSASMQMFCTKLDERLSPLSSPQNSKFKELPLPDITITTIKENKEYKAQDKELEDRSRSPVHEASIKVPSIDWSKQNQNASTDSLSESSSSSEDDAPNGNIYLFENIPRVEVHTAKDSDIEDILLDSLCPEVEEKEVIEKSSLVENTEQFKSITSEKKSLNQPKALPNMEMVLPEVHNALHVKMKSDKEDSPEENKSIKTTSGKSSPEGTTAPTETELSDWARDENVSDGIEIDVSRNFVRNKDFNIADLSEFDETNNHDYYRNSKETIYFKEGQGKTLGDNFNSIEYMDTGTETSSDDGVVDSQNGYVLFKNEDQIVEDSLNPIIDGGFEARNHYLFKKENKLDNDLMKNFKGMSNNFGGEVIDLTTLDLEKLKQKQALTDHEEDSLLILETVTTTEENTCSDSTIKNVTEINADNEKTKYKPSLKMENLEREEKIIDVNQIIDDRDIENSLQFDEHCQRLQSKVEFSNVKDSLDIRKSRRKSKCESSHKDDLIGEEGNKISLPKNTVNIISATNTEVFYKKENIKKERDVNKKLIEEMVMNKMRAENKSLERKKRGRINTGFLSPSRTVDIQKSYTADIESEITSRNIEERSKPDRLSNSVSLQKNADSTTVSTIQPSREKCSPVSSIDSKQCPSRPLSLFSSFTNATKLSDTSKLKRENSSVPNIRNNLLNEKSDETSIYTQNVDASTRTEKMKENARARAKLLSNEALGLSPENKLDRLREIIGKKGKENIIFDSHAQESIQSLVLNTERRNSLLYNNDTLAKKRTSTVKRSRSGNSELVSDVSNSTFTVSMRPKSISEIPKNIRISDSMDVKNEMCMKIFKSDPNLPTANGGKPKKKEKDSERRKSLTQLIVGIFTKRSPTSNGTKGLFAKLTPKPKVISKDGTKEETIKQKSNSEIILPKYESSPPPIPPLPLNYTMKASDESSDGEVIDYKNQEHDSCDTLDHSVNKETSTSSLTGTTRRSIKAKRVSRQAQLKRHRMAQEIQRKLEETEVKTREIEQRGVRVEKALRGEDNEKCSKDESELLQEWFDLMRDMSELRRYEKELMVRAQELELEDRHSRLQSELRERLDTGETKTEEDLKIEESIINEMMEIVSNRDSLLALLEEDRKRYLYEDKDLEEQMLAKGLMLTQIQKTAEN